MTSEKTENIKASPLSIKEICNLYKISSKTWRAWYIKKKEIIGDKIGGKFTPKQVQTIFNEFGTP